jgi:hypothetical protein
MAAFSDALDWLRHHAGLTGILVVAWIGVLVGSVWAVRWFLLSIPPDHFTKPHAPLEQWKHYHPVLRWTILIGKNLLGLALALAGVVMLFTPGQGILAILLGVSLIDIPGKRTVERKIIERPAVLRLVNAMRAGAGKPPLEFAAPGDSQ